MIEYFILFTVIGFIIGALFDSNINVITFIILIITVIWAFIYGLWSIATLIELLLGVGIYHKLKKHRIVNE